MTPDINTPVEVLFLIFVTLLKLADTLEKTRAIRL